jgi:adenosine/AMP kinase
MPFPCDQLEDIGVGHSEVFGTGLTSLIASMATAAALTFAGLSDTVADTANATSALVAPVENDALASGNALAMLTDKLTARNILTSTANGQTTAFVSADVLAVSTGNASSTITSGKDSDALANGTATSSLFGGANRAPVLITEQATATSVLLANPENNPLATGNASSTIIQKLSVVVQATSTGDGSSSVIDGQTPASFVTETGSAASASFCNTIAYNTVLESVLATSDLFVPPSDMAWVINTESTAMWRYTDYPLRWAASIKGTVVGLTDAGLCQVHTANNVPWHIDTGWNELGDQHKKRLTYTYVGGVYPVNAKLEVGVDMSLAFYTYPLLNTRATIGKGLNARYWRFRFSGKGAATILDIRSDVAASARRI